jgi:uncharacterized repeat protein (TIGR03803 family)
MLEIQPQTRIKVGKTRCYFALFCFLFCLMGGSLTLLRAESSCQIFKSFGTSGRSISGLIEDSNGWMFGTILSDTTAGSVFKIQSNGSNYTTLHTFSSIPQDGSKSFSRLLLLGDVLFGTTQRGGSSNFGTIFRLNRDGTAYELLHHFTGATNDGQFPYAGLVAGSDGSLYGTTIGGGLNNRGTVYKIQPNGTGYQILLHCSSSFVTNGFTPYSGLVLGKNNILFGTTFSGGNRGAGTVFRMNPDGSDYQVIHQFGTAADGRNSYSSLIYGSDGFLYGTTPFGGSFGEGSVFKLREDGSDYSRIASFGSTQADGISPYQGLTSGAGGVLYGVSSAGGTNNTGTMFKIAINGSGYQTLCHFGTNESAASDLFCSPQNELYGSLSYSQGADTGSLFKFVFPGIVALGATQDGFSLQLSGVPGLTYTVETSEDLITWHSWLTTNLVTSSLEVLDPDPRPAYRFYRAR